MVFGVRKLEVRFKDLKVRLPVVRMQVSFNSWQPYEKRWIYILDRFGDAFEHFSVVGSHAGNHLRVRKTGFDEPDVEESRIRGDKRVAQEDRKCSKRDRLGLHGGHYDCDVAVVDCVGCGLWQKAPQR